MSWLPQPRPARPDRSRAGAEDRARPPALLGPLASGCVPGGGVPAWRRSQDLRTTLVLLRLQESRQAPASASPTSGHSPPCRQPASLWGLQGSGEVCQLGLASPKGSPCLSTLRARWSCPPPPAVQATRVWGRAASVTRARLDRPAWHRAERRPVSQEVTVWFRLRAQARVRAPARGGGGGRAGGSGSVILSHH